MILCDVNEHYIWQFGGNGCGTLHSLLVYCINLFNGISC